MKEGKTKMAKETTHRDPIKKAERIERRAKKTGRNGDEEEASEDDEGQRQRPIGKPDGLRTQPLAPTGPSPVPRCPA